MARRKQRNELAAGTFIAVAVVLAAVVVLALADWQSLFQRKKTVTVIFSQQSIKGLKAGSDVMVKGVAVGKVRQVRLDYGATEHITAIIELPATLVLYANAQLTIATNPLGGGAWIEIRDVGQAEGYCIRRPDLPADCYITRTAEVERIFGGATQPEIGARAVVAVPLADEKNPIYGSESANQFIAEMSWELGYGQQQRKELAELMRAMTDSAIALNQMLRQAQTTMMPRVDEALCDIQKISGIGVELMDTLNKKIPAGLDTVEHTIRDVHDLLDRQGPVIEEAIKRINNVAGTLDDGSRQQLANVQAAMKQLARVLAQAEEAMGNIRDATATVRDVLTVNRDTINDTLANLREGSEHLSAGLGEIRREPWRLLYTPKPSEERAANILAATRAYSEGAASLRDATTRLSAFINSRGQSPNSDDPQYRRLLKELTESQERFDKAEKALYLLLDADK